MERHLLKYLLDPGSKYTGRQLRWLLRLSSFDIDLETRPSKKNVVADFLSRHPTRSEYGQDVFEGIGGIHHPTRLVLSGGTLQRVPTEAVRRARRTTTHLENNPTNLGNQPYTPIGWPAWQYR